MTAKQELRERVWDELEDEGVARFPFPPHGRIPNFANAEDAADRLAETDAWTSADAIKANPDAPQRPVRQRALRAGKTVYQAVPRLRDEKCFVELDPEDIEDVDEATTVGGAPEQGVQVHPDEVDLIDLIVCGSVAVDDRGARIGKGEGYSDLEYAILTDLGLVEESTPVVTTVHERQVRTESWTVDAHDVPLSLIATPERTDEPEHDGANDLDRPAGVDWELLEEERIDEMPVLARLAGE